MPTEKDMSEWYIEIKRKQLTDLFAQYCGSNQNTRASYSRM